MRLYDHNEILIDEKRDTMKNQIKISGDASLFENFRILTIQEELEIKNKISLKPRNFSFLVKYQTFENECMPMEISRGDGHPL